ncbi:CRISPR-associated endonuclease Cas6/Csy4 [Marinomonas spartinae]|uniref:CRISPR-associated endonuclease Cas6/Csy4 n=1 Tax=Marinomonas spartinae TaxID=1792290 RepID=A0A1A8T6U2_9GAMM|nr:type I-F CRISPR-associated endoribonuclease Cas6/Csy4 [Marinomonas spartinae]SBS28189.1 CRISPR-associated endonuclease Cas6/Csy4 [Marinomonas spartinae]
MRFYQEITLIKTPEISPYFIWGKLYMQLHLALVEQQNPDKTVNTGVSFPEYKYIQKEDGVFASLGSKLRVFANTEIELQQLNLVKWLDRLTDYVHIKSVAEVPDNVQGYETFNRRCKSGSPDKHIRRRMKRHNETWEQAAEFFKGYNMEKADKDLPFIRMKSLHSDNEFCMSITRKEAELSNKHVMFNTYGLSAEGVLPKF